MSEIERFKDKINSLPSEEFFLFFNNSKNEIDSWKEGEKEFDSEIITPLMDVCDFLNDAEEKIALEIGFGGGRLIAAAAKIFKGVYGVDIHTRQKIVTDKLISFGLSNFCLLQNEGDNIPLENQFVDFVYSYIVFQHLDTIEVTIKYLKEVFRVLKSGGHAVIYFGHSFPNETETYVEKIKKPVNHTNIRLAKGYALGLVMGIGFDVVRVRLNQHGTQFALIIKKP